ncbi:MAG: hypothetical protein ABJA78_09460 [Ferruginibacter sp.]
MRFFSKFVFICNLCFIAVIVMRFVEMHKTKAGNRDAIIPLPFVEGTLALLGYMAIILNFVFLLTAIIMKLSRKAWTFQKWIFWINLLFFFLQIYFHLFYNG